MRTNPANGELILFQTTEGTVQDEVLHPSETFWLNQKKSTELFGIEVPTISYHLKEIHDAGELRPESTVGRIRGVQREGGSAASVTHSVSGISTCR
jgi:hypothetical protein